MVKPKSRPRAKKQLLCEPTATTPPPKRKKVPLARRRPAPTTPVRLLSPAPAPAPPTLKEKTPPPPPHPPPYSVRWKVLWKEKEVSTSSTLSSMFSFQLWTGETIKTVQAKADEKGYTVERLKATAIITYGNKAQGDSMPAEYKDESDWANIQIIAQQWVIEKRSKVALYISYQYGPKKATKVNDDSPDSESSSIEGGFDTDNTSSRPYKKRKIDTAINEEKPRRTMSEVRDAGYELALNIKDGKTFRSHSIRTSLIRMYGQAWGATSYGLTTSFRAFCRQNHVGHSTGIKWLHQREESGAKAYRRIRPQSEILGRPEKLEAETYRMLAAPSNPVQIMAAFIEEEDAQHLQGCYSPNPPTPLPSQPFPFLRLPREVRDLIYDYALLRPRDCHSIYPTRICYVHPKAPADVGYNACWTPYWGTKESTRLFLVNRQISNEALKLFYSTYPFHFPQWVDVALVNATLRDTLSPWARSLITGIGFSYSWFCTPELFYLRNEEKARQTIEAVMDLLPNVKLVELTLMLGGYEVPQSQIKEAVDRALNIAGPLRGFAGLSLERIYYESARRTRIMREVRESLGCQ